MKGKSLNVPIVIADVGAIAMLIYVCLLFLEIVEDATFALPRLIFTTISFISFFIVCIIAAKKEEKSGYLIFLMVISLLYSTLSAIELIR